MSRPVTKEEMRQWIDRWRLVNQRQREELRRMTPVEKFTRLSRLMRSANVFDMSRRKSANDASRELWARLQLRARGRD